MNVCSVCRKQKNTLTKKNSTLMPGVQMWYCKEDLDKEPRYIIIIVGRQDKDAVKHYIDNDLYVGPKVTDADLA